MDQANRLRGMIRDQTGASPHRSGRIIAVASGKGGVGKSIVALNLATELARRGRSVALIDADLGMGSLEILSGASAVWNIAHVATGAKSLDDVLIESSHGIHIAVGASGHIGLAGASERDCDRLCQAISTASRRFDEVIVDLSAGIGPAVQPLAALADERIVVTTPEPTAIAGAYAFLKALAEPAGGVSLLVNLADSAPLVTRVFDRFSATAARFAGVAVRDAGDLPRDLAVARSVQNRVPFVISEPRSPAAKKMSNVADRLLQMHVVVESGFAETLATVSPTVAAA